MPETDHGHWAASAYAFQKGKTTATGEPSFSPLLTRT